MELIDVFIGLVILVLVWLTAYPLTRVRAKPKGGTEKAIGIINLIQHESDRIQAMELDSDTTVTDRMKMCMDAMLRAQQGVAEVMDNGDGETIRSTNQMTVKLREMFK